ncbi:MAG: hypothetical protein AB1467_01475 [Candidatus Diapherotrites archaeon]
MKNNSGITENCFGLKERELMLYDLILKNWPTTAIELAAHCNESIASRHEKKKASSKYSYYLKKLIDKQLILSKRSGHTLIVWPLVVEKYKVIHSILNERK